MGKLAFVLPNWATLTRDEVIYYAKLGEDLNYDTIWIPETWGNDAFTIMNTIAENTTRIKFGCGIISVFSRSAANIAQTIATIDTFSGGRAILGLGPSTNIVNENWHGMKHERPLRRTREYVEIIRLILSGERVTYEGEIIKIRNMKFQTKPLRRNIPVYLASLGPKNLELTGQLADGWLPFLCPESHINKLKKNVEDAALKAGRSMSDITICPYVPALLSSDNQEEADFKIKEFISFYVGAMGPHYYNLVTSYGFGDDAVNIREAWNNKDLVKCAESVSDELLDLVAVKGTADSAHKKLDSYREVSDCPILMFPFKSTKEQILETLEALAPVN